MIVMKHKKSCWKILSPRAFCNCGALGTLEKQRRAARVRAAKHPTKNWRVQGDKGEADTVPLGPFDEIAVGHWLHVEMMDRRSAFVSLGTRCFWLHLKSNGSVVITDEEQRD